MTNEKDLISNFQKYYLQSLQVLNEFGGPSVYFHTQCIKEQCSNFLSDRHIELIYATLASWGMHRMGDPRTTRTKLHDFKNFKESIIVSRAQLQVLTKKDLINMDESEYSKILEDLKEIYLKLKVSISNSKLVGNAKTLAHIIPNLIPPIDRQYTIRFFTQQRNEFFNKSGKYRQVSIPNSIDIQFQLFIDTCIEMKRLLGSFDKNLMEINPETFNTSYPKIIDNVIMAYVKNVPRPA